MGRLIVKLMDEDGEGLYMEWSTVVDAPVSSLMPLSAFSDWYSWRYPRAHDNALSERLERVKENGTSALDGTTPEDLLSFNRAGEGESHLTKAEIIDQYRDDGN